MTTRVLAAVIERNGRLLLCERPLRKRHGGMWEFPGGKVEPGESDFVAVSRELAEELGVRVLAVGGVEYSTPDAGSAFVIEFIRVEIAGEPQQLEHTALAWVEPADLPTYRLAPSDRRYVEEMMASAIGSGAGEPGGAGDAGGAEPGESTNH